jgi:hypothetical protein
VVVFASVNLETCSAALPNAILPYIGIHSTVLILRACHHILFPAYVRHYNREHALPELTAPVSPSPDIHSIFYCGHSLTRQTVTCVCGHSHASAASAGQRKMPRRRSRSGSRACEKLLTQTSMRCRYTTEVNSLPVNAFGWVCVSKARS